MNKFYEQVYDLVEKVPYGKVVSYGQIAIYLGKPRSSREVGRAMRVARNNIPWQRVVMADGTVTGGEFANMRRDILTEEGIKFLLDGRVDMKLCRYEFL